VFWFQIIIYEFVFILIKLILKILNQIREIYIYREKRKKIEKKKFLKMKTLTVCILLIAFCLNYLCAEQVNNKKTSEIVIFFIRKIFIL